MSLYKRGSVYWTYINIDGIRHAKSTGARTRRQAEEFEKKFRDELNARRFGLSQLAPDLPFAKLAARFLAEGSPKPYHVDRLKVLLPFWGEMAIGSITRAHAREYRAWRHAIRQNLSDHTINRDLEALRHILFWAVDEGFLVANPMARVQMIRLPREPRLVLSLTEEEKLLSAAAPHLRAMIIASLDTGMRRGEILTQRWEHVDFDRRLICVTHSKTVPGTAREIPLTNRMCDLLASSRQSEGFVFTFDGKPVKKIKTAWKAAVRRASIPYRRFHDLRHTFNTRLLDAGVLADVRRALMGHSSNGDVNAIYTHVEVPQKRKAIQQLENWIASQRAEAKKGASAGTQANSRNTLPEVASGCTPSGATVCGSFGTQHAGRPRCRHRNTARGG